MRRAAHGWFDGGKARCHVIPAEVPSVLDGDHPCSFLQDRRRPVWVRDRSFSTAPISLAMPGVSKERHQSTPATRMFSLNNARTPLVLPCVETSALDDERTPTGLGKGCRDLWTDREPSAERKPCGERDAGADAPRLQAHSSADLLARPGLSLRPNPGGKRVRQASQDNRLADTSVIP